MEETTSRVPRRNVAHEASPTRRGRRTISTVGEAAGSADHQIRCSGKHCGSCTGGVIADCVAICCCPCAVVNFLALAFVKVPWIVGRRCLAYGKQKLLAQKLKKTKPKCKTEENESVVVVRDEYDWLDENVRSKLEERMLEKLQSAGSSEEEAVSVSKRFEAENIWLELCQIGHLDFGRVSFTGVQISN